MNRSHASIHSLRIAGYLASHLSSIASRAAAAVWMGLASRLMASQSFFDA